MTKIAFIGAGSLGFTRALARDIKILLLDEPYEGLAPTIVREIETILLELKQLGFTSIIVEQNAVAALKLADRAVILERSINHDNTRNPVTVCVR